MSKASKVLVKESLTGTSGIKLSPCGSGYIKGKVMYINIPLVVQEEYKNLLTSEHVDALVTGTLLRQYPDCRVVPQLDGEGNTFYAIVKDMGIYPTVLVNYTVSLFFEVKTTLGSLAYGEVKRAI